MLLSLAALKGASEDELIDHCTAVAKEMPLVGFYLQTAVGGIPLSRGFWARFAAIDNVVAIKVAPFNRYRTLDVAVGVVQAHAEDRITLYTGNDDHIVADLVTPMVVRTGNREVTLRPLAPEPVAPFNVFSAADAPILTDTELMSYGYQHLLAGTPWQFYRLVVTQWPRREGNQATPVPATLDGGIANTFPGTGAFSAFTNVTMETFDQTGVQLGCMSCHNRTRLPTDFMWTVADHAYPSRFR